MNLSVLLKRQAREALKRDFATVLLIALMAALPMLLCRALLSMGLARCTDLTDWVNATVVRNVTYEQILEMFAPGRDFFLAAGIMAVLAFLLAFLNLGQIAAELKLLREKPIVPGDALSRAGLWLKVMGLWLWQGLWLFLWSLPGNAVMLAGSWLMFRSLGLGSFLMNVGSLASTVMVIRAALRYSLGSVVLADRPGTGALEAQRESIRMMKGRSLLLLFLILSFLLLELAIFLLSMLLPGLLGTTLGMALDLALSVYVSTSVCAFYEFCLKVPDLTQPVPGFSWPGMQEKAPLLTEEDPESGDGAGEPKEPVWRDWTDPEAPEEPESPESPEKREEPGEPEKPAWGDRTDGKEPSSPEDKDRPE